MSHIIIGTAGHIDHGKTALVKALTGVDTDKLKEEKERGLTIDLGFAHFGDKATIIDVPGHEKFVRNMVAGVSTIDLVLFVVAADDGVMPQTREHLDILRILQVKHGVIVITKADLVEKEWLLLIKEEINNLTKGTFLQNAQAHIVSTITGAGIPGLKTAIETMFSQIQEKKDRGIFWMPVDRAFTMKGFGTVATGSVLSGAVQIGDTIELLPQKKRAKIRGLQSHGKPVEHVTTGDRAAINLQAIDREEVGRGDVVASPNYFTSSQRIDARLTLLESAPRALKPGMRIRLHFGTTEIMARISLFSVSKIDPGKSGFVQFHLEKPASSRRLDPFVVRQYSPTITIGGGVILDPNAKRHKKNDPALLGSLQALEKESPEEVLLDKLQTSESAFLSMDKLSSEIATSKESIAGILDKFENEQKIIRLRKGGRDLIFLNNNYDKLQTLFLEALANFHKKNPARSGVLKSKCQNLVNGSMDTELLDFLLKNLRKNDLIKETDGSISLKDHVLKLSTKQQELRKGLTTLLMEEGFATSSEIEMAVKLDTDCHEIAELLTIMIGSNEVIRVDGNIYFHQKRVEEARKKVAEFFEQKKEITVSEFKELLNGTSRKYAMPLLNYFDNSGLTERRGDVRVLGNNS